MPIPDRALAVLEEPKLAHLVTINADGRPRVSCVWVGVEDGEIVAAHLNEQQKLRNIRRDARVALSIETDSMNAIGLTEYLVVHGRARITEGGAADLLQRLAYSYLSPNVKFPPMLDPPSGYVTRITPERFCGVGPWSART